MLDRILKSYQKEIEDFPRTGVYSSSGLWRGAEKPYDYLEHRLKNFGSDPISDGLSLFKDEMNRERIIRYVNLWKRLTGLDFSILNYPSKFGLRTIRLDDSLTTISTAPRFAYYAQRISELVKDGVIEIGGSFGAVPFHLFRDFNYQGTYCGFDLPHSLLLAKYFLTQMFPEKTFRFYGENKPADIYLLPHYEMPNCKNADLVFNAHSLSEMGREQIEEYVKQIGRLDPNYFLHFNHEMQTTKEGETLPDQINLSELPIPMKKIGKWFEIFSGDDQLDYFEYLYAK